MCFPICPPGGYQQQPQQGYYPQQPQQGAYGTQQAGQTVYVVKDGKKKKKSNYGKLAAGNIII